MSISVEGIQQIIGYRFGSEKLLDRALTHRSAAGPNNERLAFLGDSVLGLLVAAELFRRFPDCDEGSLTLGRARLVRQETLAAVARKIDLGPSPPNGPLDSKSPPVQHGPLEANVRQANGWIGCQRSSE